MIWINMEFELQLKAMIKYAMLYPLFFPPKKNKKYNEDLFDSKCNNKLIYKEFKCIITVDYQCYFWEMLKPQ